MSFMPHAYECECERAWVALCGRMGMDGCMRECVAKESWVSIYVCVRVLVPLAK